MNLPLIFVSTFLLILFYSSFAKGEVSRIEDTNSMVFIWAQDKENPTKLRPLGSGFLLTSTGWALTAQHVVGKIVSSEHLVVSISTKSNARFAIDPNDIRCARNFAPDICFIRIPTGAVTHAQIKNFYKVGCYLPNPEEALRVLAFPGGSDPFSGVEQYTGKITGGQILESLIPTDIGALTPGTSGGPVFDTTGTVIGIVKGADATSSGRTFVSPLQGITSDFLNIGIRCRFEP